MSSNMAWGAACAAALVAGIAAWVGCGGDACETLADDFAACGSSVSTGTGGVVCTDREKMQAQCVLDAQIDPNILCKIKAGTATPDEQQAYSDCYAN